MKQPKIHKSKIEFGTYRTFNGPLTVFIERVRTNMHIDDQKTLVEFKGRKFDNYQDVDNFCASPYAQSVLRATRKYFVEPAHA